MTSATTLPPAGESSGVLLLWILRAGVAACYIGHGMLGVLRTAAWTPYFAVAGIGRETALGLMPWVGVFDIALGLSVLFYPVRGVAVYLVAWCGWTALLRPLAGESGWEAVERAGNYGAPLALFLLLPGAGAKFWWRGGSPATRDMRRRLGLAWVLRLTTVFLLLGHGMLNWMVQKPMFVTQYNLIGLPGAVAEPLIGGFECLLALAVLFKPTRGLLFGVAGWKLATEALNPMAGSSLWVYVEHGGSYAAPLVLAFLLPRFHPLPFTRQAPAN